MEAFGKFVWSLLLCVLVTIYGGWVLQVLWGWFIVPLGVASISVTHAVGINVLLSMLLFGYTDVKTAMKSSDSGESDSNAMVVYRAILLTITLVMGYITVQFM